VLEPYRLRYSSHEHPLLASLDVLNDPLFWILVLPGLLLGLYAQGRIKLNFAKYSQVGTQGGITGAEVARRLLDSQGLQDVAIESTPGILKDHYDPRSKTLSLSQDVYYSPSVAAAGVAAHEAGHALQDAEDYFPMEARTYIVPIVQLAAQVAPWLFVAGLLLQLPTLTWVGIILFGSSSLFAFLTLPVEFNASARAQKLLVSQGIIKGDDQIAGVQKVLGLLLGPTWRQPCPQSVSGFSTFSFCSSEGAQLRLACDLGLKCPLDRALRNILFGSLADMLG
jgi:Zn-dependent membrane protease YugP